MAGSIIISSENVWTVGIHAFLPIIEMLKRAHAKNLASNEEMDAIFVPLDQGFDYVSICHLSAPEFRRFVDVCETERQAILNHASGGDPKTALLDSCICDLLSQLRTDPRYTTMS